MHFCASAFGAVVVRLEPLNRVPPGHRVGLTSRWRRRSRPPKPSAGKLFKQGVQKYRQRQYAQAIKLFQAAVDEDPQFGAAYFNAARTYEELGKLEDAANYYRQASEKGKNFSEGYANLGRIKLMMNQPDEANIAFDKAREAISFRLKFISMKLQMPSRGKTTKARERAFVHPSRGTIAIQRPMDSWLESTLVRSVSSWQNSCAIPA